MALIPVVDGNFTIRSSRHACQPVNANRNFFWVPYFGIVVKAGNNKTIITTIILPVDDDNEARGVVSSVERTVDSSGNLTLSFAKDGRTYVFNYNNDSEGLVLEQ
jgi:hypothetical protein